MEVKVGPETILLRPTFENIAAMESVVGSVSYLGWKFSRGIRQNAEGGVDARTLNTAEAIKGMPSMTEVAQIIYFNQAATKENDATRKKFSLEEIWDLVSQEGMRLVLPIMTYIANITAGDKMANTDAPSEAEKKS